MSGVLLDQAASLMGLVSTGRSSSLGLIQFEAAFDCAERLNVSGYPAKALELLDSVLPTLPADAGQLRIRLECQALRALVLCYRYAECLERATSSAASLQSFAASHELDYLTLGVFEGLALVRMNRVGEGITRLTTLATVLRTKPDSSALAQCLVMLGTAYIGLGDWESARRFSIEAVVSARRTSSAFHEGAALGNLCIAERGRCRYLSSEDAGREAIEAHRRAGATVYLAHCQRSLAITELKRGKAAKAIAQIEASLKEAGELLTGWQSWFGKLVLAQARLHVGDVEAARQQLSTVFHERGDISESRAELLRLEYLGDIELEQGHLEAALKRYDDVLPHALALIPRGDVVAEIRRRRAECLLMLGRSNDANAEAKLALELCLELGDRYEEAATYRTLALTIAALGKHDEAQKYFVHGFAMYDDIETPYEWGKLWMSYGDWLSGPHAGAYESLAGAREAFRAACDHFEHMGAELKLAQARERLAKLEQRMLAEGLTEPAAGEKPRPRRRPSMDRDLQRRVQWSFDTFGIVTRHRPLIELLEQLNTVAISDIPVLILGESGTGKELLARGVHSISGRTGSLVEVNCSAVPATMMEAEFFGSLHGSYTGSTRDRAGLFEEAHGGSIFLDEIGEMPVDLQSKLLRFLETGEVRRIGSNAGRKVDSRLIAATNREASRLNAGEGFRPDLYYRLAHAVFTLPPLRSRGDDVAMLVDHFLEDFSQEARKRVAISSAARERIATYSWPGNVRQLRSLIQRLVIQTPDGQVVTPRDIPLGDQAEAPRNFSEEMESQEKARIREALEKTHYIKSDAARILRMSRTTLLGKMKRYGILG